MGNPNKPTKDRISQIYGKLVASLPLDEQESFLSLEDFVLLYQQVVKRVDDAQAVHIVLLGNNAAVKFLRFPQVHFVIREKRRLTQKDFSRTVVQPIFDGDRLDYSLWGQIKEERRNWAILLVAFVATFALMLVTGASVAVDYDKYLLDPTAYVQVGQAVEAQKTVAELIVTSATLFISLFLVFAVMQNVDMAKDEFLFRTGLVYKYYRDDRFIGIAALISLFVGVATVVLLVTPISIWLGTLTLFGTPVTVNKISIVAPMMIAFSATALTLCFVSVFYYFQRTMTNIGAAMAKKILDESPDNPPKTDKYDDTIHG